MDGKKLLDSVMSSQVEFKGVDFSIFQIRAIWFIVAVTPVSLGRSITRCRYCLQFNYRTHASYGIFLFRLAKMSSILLLEHA